MQEQFRTIATKIGELRTKSCGRVAGVLYSKHGKTPVVPGFEYKAPARQATARRNAIAVSPYANQLIRIVLIESLVATEENMRQAIAFLLPLVMLVLSSQAKADEKPSQALTNSLGMKLMLIPAGEFLMGAPRTIRTPRSTSGRNTRRRSAKPSILAHMK